jgi:amino acid transporter
MAEADQQVGQPDQELVRDEQRLAQLGYKQELARAWSSFTNFAISFTIISVLAGTFTTFGQAWNAGGPIAISIGWPVICAFVLLVAVSMSELTSAFPTAGGPYWWAATLGGKGWSWFTGWFNIVGLLGIVASVGYGAASFLYALLGLYGVDVIGINFGDAKHVLSETFLLFLLILLLISVVNIFADRLLGLINNISVGWHVLGVAAVIAIGAAKGVWRSVFYSALFGWFVLLAFLFAATDEKAITDGGGGVIPIFDSALTSAAAKAVILIATVGQLFCSAACLTSCSRTWYAFSRDRGIPGWWLFRRLTSQRVPLYAVLAGAFFSLLISIPALWGNKAGFPFAFFALTGICTVGLYIAYTIPVYLRLRRGEKFERGPWHLGRHYRWINAGALLFVVVVVITLDLPFTHAAVPWNSDFDATALNYTPGVLLVGILVAIWWAVSAKNRYTGPVRTIETDELGRVVGEERGPEPPPAPGGPAPTPAS